MLDGSSSANVMPGNVSATINISRLVQALAETVEIAIKQVAAC